MWLADGDFNIPVPGGPSGVAIAAIFAIAFVLGIYLKLRRPPDPAAVRQVAEDALDAAASAATSAMAAQLALKDRKIALLEAELDDAYRAGFKPTRPHPRPDGHSD